jgi:membrane dipeptidase
MLKTPLIFDAHLDLSMNALEWNRDLRWPVKDIRKSEGGMNDKPDRAKGTVSLPSMREGHVGVCVATQIGRYVKRGNSMPGWNSQEQAWAQTQGQLAWYNAMEDAGEMVQIRTSDDLEKHLKLWENPLGNAAIGYILSLEGADSIVSMHHLEKAYDYGLRAIGPAHYGPGTYAHGTDSNGGISIKGRKLLKEMERLGIILDATHLCDESFREALDIYNGPVWASHNNCRAFVPHNRQFTDSQITELIDREAVIGVALDAWMMVPGWVRGKSDPRASGVSLKLMINNIDHICQLAGNSLHAGIGSDLDGAFGREQCPYDLDTIADLQKVTGLLSEIGYAESDIQNVLSNNWIRFLKKNLPLSL